MPLSEAELRRIEQSRRDIESGEEDRKLREVEKFLEDNPEAAARYRRENAWLHDRMEYFPKGLPEPDDRDES